MEELDFDGFNHIEGLTEADVDAMAQAWEESQAKVELSSEIHTFEEEPCLF